VKVINKNTVVSLDAVEHTLSERRILSHLSHPFLVSLKFSFQTEDSLHLVMDYINGGELFYHMTHSECFSKERARFYAAEIVLALGFLHENNIIYRDLKPENLLLDMFGHICVTDFGLSKDNMPNGAKTHSFVGSPEYLAPEMIMGEGYDKAVDWWALGTLLYEMMAGWPPFYSENAEVMQRNILSSALIFPPHFDDNTRSIIRALLDRNPKRRLREVEEIKNHSYFADIDWQLLLKKKIDPPFKPHLLDESDVRYFDEEFTNEAPAFTPQKSTLTEAQQEAFKGFSYVAPQIENYLLKRRKMSRPPSLEPVTGASASPGNLPIINWKEVYEYRDEDTLDLGSIVRSTGDSEEEQLQFE